MKNVPWLTKLWTLIKRGWHRYQLTRWLVVVFLTITLVGSTYLVVVAKTADVKSLNSKLKQTTTIYDRNNTKAGYLYSQKGTWVDIDQISPHVEAAVLSTEDRNFYKEYGFSVKGIARAAFLLAKNKLLHRDYISGGGSTITQQLAKNAFLTQQQTFSRKAKEIFIAMQIENTYSKKEILTMYLNNAYFGNGVWGVQDAARKYFGVNASQLTVPQAATLAGMLTSPNSYNPEDHPQASTQRRNVVLELMHANNKLSQTAMEQYQNAPMTTSDRYEYKSGYRYPYFFDAVINEAIKKYGLSESEVMNGGYKIYTTLDQTYQQKMQTAFANDALFPYNAADGATAQGASIAVSPKTGGVLAVVGGRSGSHVFRGYNRATQLVRSPGSTIKPLAVYTPALQAGYHYDSMVKDEYRAYGTNHYQPHNWNNQYSGELPMYQALALSKNTSAVWLLNKIGVNAGYNSVKKFGLPVNKNDKNLSLALGGLDKGVSPQQMAGAYTAFADDGTRHEPYYITKIVDSAGKTIVDADPKANRVMSTKIANQMTSMMLDVYAAGGTGYTAKPDGYTIAGKTGTTESTDEGEPADKDHWYVGYTKDIVVATWVGFDSSNHSLQDEGVRGGSLLFKTEMEGILPNTAQTQFDVQSASTMAKAKQANSSEGEDVWNEIKNTGDNLKSKAKEWFSNSKQIISNWFGG
ncbi:PBP1A family penicillin-binding protein [Ligilactobacillus saerimneri]|uniref:PBP1A family penicillin-binding protein n=1 Tax=Ligilactobacillus saerimneri TaxID=228229 RepID=UPI001C121DD9|nr:PBP1A family penicillin-binding protein [Ligilactobacillus saerimneri]MBU5308900.1 PBP1A family penicillin-binding protein [Ligilactobacillus saerimneri]